VTGHLPVVEEAELPWWQRIEQGIVIFILATMVIVPVVTVTIRLVTGNAIASANLWVQALNLWLAFLGGAIAARTGRHLSLSTGNLFAMSDRLKATLDGFTSAVATAVTAWLAYGSADLVRSEMESSLELGGGVPLWAVQLGMPIGFGLMAGRFALRGRADLPGRVAILAVALSSAALAWVPAADRGWVVWGGGAVLLLAVAFGAPLFTIMGGMAMLLFYGAPIPIALSAVPAETFRIVSDPTLVSLPLFTLSGYLLAEGGASKRLVALFNAWFGWLPGGVAAAAVLVCAFFTTFTGASGVTILALGGLLLPALEEAGYERRFAVGLLAASGSIGLLFPPSLPVILYGVASHVSIIDLFIGGLVPGLILVSLLVGMSVFVALRKHGLRVWLPAPDGPPLTEIVGARVRLGLDAAWIAKWELALPVLVLYGIFGGIVTIFEAAAFTAAYAFFIEVVVHRDLHLGRQVPGVFVETAALMGGVLVILGVALGFTSYLVDAEVPMAVRDWVQGRITNKLVFILALNLLLLLVGCLMDIYSAIVVVVPLIIPVAEVFGIHPVHLGILFLANLELGYLTPPVGLNLFLASFRFNIPLTDVYRYAFPFLLMMGFGVLIIAYVPYATLWSFDEDSATPTPDFFEDEAAAPDGQPAVPPPLTPEQLEAMLNEVEGGAAAPAPTPTPTPAAAPPAPGTLNMEDIFNELDEE
jgi:C4-dicarboxylate transporter DctM subunit